MDRPSSDHGDSSPPPSGSSASSPDDATRVVSYGEASQPTQWATPTPSFADTPQYGATPAYTPPPADPYGSTPPPPNYPPPADPYGSTPPPSYPPPPGGYPGVPGALPPPGYGPAPARGTNTMAIIALVCGLLLGPLGIIFGHISLSQIKKTGEEGKGMAIAGLVLGYLSLVCGLVAAVILVAVIGVVSNEVENNRSTYSRATPTTAYSSIGAPDSTSLVIKNARVGDCLHKVDGAKNADGTYKVTVSKATCGTSYSTHKVTKRTTSTSDCSNDWVRTTSYDPPVVLCLKRD